MPQNIEDAPAVALGAVGDEDFVVGHIHAEVAVIVLCNGVPEKLVSLLGPVAAEALARGHLIDRFVQRADHCGRQRFGHIADTATDYPLGGFGIGVTERFHAPGDLGKEVTGL